MRTKLILKAIFISLFAGFFAIAFTTGCVSVNLSAKAGGRATSVFHLPPQGDYEEFKTTDADHAYRSKSSGNSISYHSVCDEPSDPTLQTMQSTTLGSLSENEIKSEKHISFNGRDAVDTRADGTVDGVKVGLRFLVFKRNNCNYTLSYIALKKFFDADEPKFEEFLKGFRAP